MSGSKVDLKKMEEALARIEALKATGRTSDSSDYIKSVGVVDEPLKVPAPKVPEITVIVPPHDKPLIITVRETDG